MRTFLEVQWDQYLESVYSYAEERFTKIVKPFLLSRRVCFTAGNGTYLLSVERQDWKGFISIDPDRARRSPKWKPIIELLETEISGFNGLRLGSQMPDLRVEFGPAVRGFYRFQNRGLV